MNQRQTCQPGPTISDTKNNKREGEGETAYKKIPREELDRAGGLNGYCHEQGVAGEQRVARLLEDLGLGRVTHGISLQSRGTAGYPDLTLRTPRAFYAIEVKSMLPFRGHRGVKQGWQVGSVKLVKRAWEAMSRWATSHGLARMMIVEVRIPRSGHGHLYHFIPGHVVDWGLKQTHSDIVHFSLYDLPAMALLSLRPGIPQLKVVNL